MGFFKTLFGTREASPESAEIETMRISMLQIKAHGGPQAMLREFSEGMREVREPDGYRGFVVENEYLPRIAAKACALMILSDIKSALLIKGPPTDSDLGRIAAAPDYRTAHELFVNSDEIVQQTTVESLREATMKFGEENFAHVGQPGFGELMMKSPIRVHVAELKKQSELDWVRWTRSGTRLKV